MTLMIVAEISQLTDGSTRFLIDRLNLTKTDEEASADFKSKIEEATNAWYRRIDNVFHNVND